jgi:acyl-CoA thioesterase-1
MSKMILVAKSGTSGPIITNKKIVCLGDSLTWMGEYPTHLGALLGGSWSIVNQGISGNTTNDMITRFTADVISQNPGYVIIWAGINDICNSLLSASTVETNLEAMYAAAAAAGIKVIAVQITPAGDRADAAFPTKQAAIDTVNAWIASKPSNVDWAVQSYTVVEDPGNPDYLLPAYSLDGLHMTDTGFDLIAQTIYDAVGGFH